MRNHFLVILPLVIMTLVGAGCKSDVATSPIEPANAYVDSVAGAVTSPEPSVPYYSGAEVAKHASINDCWVIVGSSVYDITTFLSRHNKPLDGLCGRDATVAFANGPHDDKSGTKLVEMLVGDLAP